MRDKPYEHMDQKSRMERLYDFLLQMGLVVYPVYNKEDETIIDKLSVSTHLPFECFGSKKRESDKKSGNMNRLKGGPKNRTTHLDGQNPPETITANIIDFPTES